MSLMKISQTAPENLRVRRSPRRQEGERYMDLFNFFLYV
jgi:hypothetical protein